MRPPARSEQKHVLSLVRNEGLSPTPYAEHAVILVRETEKVKGLDSVTCSALRPFESRAVASRVSTCCGVLRGVLGH